MPVRFGSYSKKKQLTELLEISKIEESDLNRSLGWLAREDKIAFYDKNEKHMVLLNY